MWLMISACAVALTVVRHADQELKWEVRNIYLVYVIVLAGLYFVPIQFGEIGCVQVAWFSPGLLLQSL